jgi:hypothetical protein
MGAQENARNTAKHAESSQAIGADAGRVSAPIGAARPEPSDAVEEALARALTQAAGDGRFDVVAQLARELEARRLARAGTNVLVMADRAKRR